MSERIYYDLTPSQDLMHYTFKCTPKKNVVNIGTAVWFTDEMDCEMLRDAAYKSIWRVDALRLRLKKVDGKIKQYLSIEEPKEIRIEDFSKLTKAKIDEKLDDWTSVPFKDEDVQLYEVVIVKGPENLTGLYIKVNHIIMDAWGLIVYAKDVVEVYSAMKDGEELPEGPNSFIPLIEKDLAYMSSEQYEKDYEFFKEQYKELPNYAAIDKKSVGKRYRSYSLKFKAKQKVLTLEKDKVEKINNFCRKNRISTQTLFILGSQLYFYKLNNTDKSMVNSVLARRNTFESKNAGGMLVNNLMMKVECPYDLSFIEACDKLSEEQFATFRHGDFPFQKAAEYIGKRADIKAGMLTDFTITYQPAKISKDGKINATIQNYCCGSIAMIMYLTIMDTLDTGTLDFLFQYKAATVSDEVVDEIFRVINRDIDIGIYSPKKTIGEILNEVYCYA